jgi:hypothetical protein
MDTVGKIVVLENEVQAGLVDLTLTKLGIPHVMRSYYDSAFDGIFQGARVWGHVEAPSNYRDEILEIVAELKKQAPPTPEGSQPGNARPDDRVN